MALKMVSREGTLGPRLVRGTLGKKSCREFDRIRMVRVREFFPSSYFWYVPSADGRRAKLSVSH